MEKKETGREEYTSLLKKTSHELLTHPKKSLQLLDRLKNSPQFDEDDTYHLVVQSLVALMHIMDVDFKTEKRMISDNIVEARRLNFPVLMSFNYNTLGNLFAAHALYSQALEAYLLALKIEEQENINVVQSCSHVNIAIVLDLMNDTKSSMKYLKRAYNAINPDNIGSDQELSQYVYIISNLLILLSKVKNLEEAGPLLDQIQKIDKTRIDKKALSNIDEALMHYYAHTGDYIKANYHYEQAKLILLNAFGPASLPRFVKDYAELYFNNHVDYAYYIDKLEDYLSECPGCHASFIARLYYILNRYYKSQGDKLNIDYTYEKYLHYSEKTLEENRADYLNVADRIHENITFMEENALIKKQNKKLKLLTEELENANSSLELAKNRLNIVTSIGQKIVSTLDLNTILTMINKNITNILPLTSFSVFTLNEIEDALESKAFFDKDSEFRNIIIPLKARDSLNVKAFLQGETIIINSAEDIQKIMKDGKLIYKGSNDVLSAMFIPVILDKKVIGVISLQSDKKNAFSKEYQHFFESLSPFLAIAIKNAKHSEKLKKEIASHKKTQEKLTLVNKELKKLSTLDSLTQIYNRRQFDSMYSKFLKKASKEELPISVCLFDIDNFKNYNDTYGHLEGDQVLVKVAGIIKQYFNEKDAIVARFGGEEFIAVQVGLGQEDIINKLNEVRSRIKKLRIVNEHSSKGYITISIGVSTNQKPKIEVKSAMMRQADECLYKAKSKGKDQVIQAIF